MSPLRRIPLDRKKLILSKWTATEPRDKEKHFVVRRVFDRRASGTTVACVELEAVLSGRLRSLSLAELGDAEVWMQGWTRDGLVEEAARADDRIR